MTDREALHALTAPEPEIWAQGNPARTSTEGVKRWDAWNRDRIAALQHAQRVAA